MENLIFYSATLVVVIWVFGGLCNIWCLDIEKMAVEIHQDFEEYPLLELLIILGGIIMVFLISWAYVFTDLKDYKYN